MRGTKERYQDGPGVTRGEMLGRGGARPVCAKGFRKNYYYGTSCLAQTPYCRRFVLPKVVLLQNRTAESPTALKPYCSKNRTAESPTAPKSYCRRIILPNAKRIELISKRRAKIDTPCTKKIFIEYFQELTNQSQDVRTSHKQRTIRKFCMCKDARANYALRFGSFSGSFSTMNEATCSAKVFLPNPASNPSSKAS